MYRTYFRFDDEVGGFDSYAICCKKAAAEITNAPTALPTVTPTPAPTPIPPVTPTLECKTIEQGGGSASNTATAACPAGWQLAGGGFHDIDQNGGGSASDEFHSRPEGNGWYVRSVGWLGTAATGPPPLDF